MSPNGIIRIFICLATLAGATLVSCRRTGHEEPVPGTGTERPDDVRVSFRIALGSTNGTRAGGTPEGSYDDGTQSEFENGIDLENGNYRFFFKIPFTECKGSWSNTERNRSDYHPHSILCRMAKGMGSIQPCKRGLERGRNRKITW